MLAWGHAGHAVPGRQHGISRQQRVLPPTLALRPAAAAGWRGPCGSPWMPWIRWPEVMVEAVTAAASTTAG